MPGPWKPYDEDTVGALTQALYRFLEYHLFVQGNPVRGNLMQAYDENQLRVMLGNYGIFIPPRIDPNDANSAPVRIMLVDIQTATIWQDHTQPAINYQTDTFYVLVMPPIPSNSHYAGQPGYQDMQAWQSAWYHAIVDGFGM
jgi:hypothetical protein